jgi:hypothetical protein
MKKKERVYDFLEDCGFTPLCDMCEYESKCDVETSDSCPKMKDIMGSFNKHFKEIK